MNADGWGKLYGSRCRICERLGLRLRCISFWRALQALVVVLQEEENAAVYSTRISHPRRMRIGAARLCISTRTAWTQVPQHAGVRHSSGGTNSPQETSCGCLPCLRHARL